MDDLLKVFLAETAECLAECQGEAAKLRQAPADAAPVDNILRLIRSVRETSGFLGMPALQVAANAAIDGLEGARAGLPDSADRVIAIADESLARMQTVVEGLVAEAAAVTAAPAPTVLATKRPSRKKKPDAEPKPPEDAEEDETATSAAAASAAAASPAVGASYTVAVAPAVPAASAPPVPAAQPAPVEPALPASIAPDGTVRVSAEMLENLLSTVSRLMAAQTEMMQLLKTKEPAAVPPVVAPPPAAAPADATTPDAAAQTAPEPPVAVAPTPAPAPRDATPITGDGKVVPLHARQSTAPRTSPEAAPAAAPKAPPPVAAGPTQRVLLFRAADRAVRAVILDRGTRLEEVDVKAIDGSRGLWVMRSAGEIFPLVPFDAAHRLGDNGRAPVIVFTFDGQSFGLLVDSVLGVGDAVVTPATSKRAGYLGCAQVDGAAVDVIDPLHYLNEAVQNRFRLGRRNDSKPRPPQPERPAIPEGDDLFVRKPAR
ncbi:MAG TPA: hypothetical protein VMQ73_08540 [Methylomirabilota bacterium]|nr:hypothetical protein [Methylomirabilota bacterium]